MKLSTLSKRVVAPLAASFTLLSGPAFAKSDLFDKGYAMGVQAGAHCHADKGYISKYQVNAITVQSWRIVYEIKFLKEEQHQKKQAVWMT